MLQSHGPTALLIHEPLVNQVGILVLTLLLLLTSGAAAGDTSTAPRAAMADAMARMMDAMGFLNPPANPAVTPPPVPYSGVPGGVSIPGLSSMTGMPGTSSWPAPGGDPSGFMNKGGEVMKQMTEGLKLPGVAAGGFPLSGSRLDGIWEGRNGELLIVQGNHFRIYPGFSGYVDGYIQLSGERLALYNPENTFISPFEFAESDGRLALRDQNGDLFLYRRLWLDQSRSMFSSPPATAEK